MTRPTELRIGHLRYAIEWDSEALDLKHTGDGISRSGESQDDRQLIKIRSRLAPDYERDTLLHEVLHQCLRVSGTHPDNDAAARVEDVEERAVSGIAGPLLGVLRDNPDLLAYLLDAA